MFMFKLPVPLYILPYIHPSEVKLFKHFPLKDHALHRPSHTSHPSRMPRDHLLAQVSFKRHWYGGTCLLIIERSNRERMPNSEEIEGADESHLLVVSRLVPSITEGAVLQLLVATVDVVAGIWEPEKAP